jgi:hypothetical protein
MKTTTKATPIRWLKLDSRKYKGPKNAPDPMAPPKRAPFLGRDSNLRVVVADEGDGHVTFSFPKGRTVGDRLLHDVRHASQDALRSFLARPGIYTAAELVRVLDQHRDGRR